MTKTTEEPGTDAETPDIWEGLKTTKDGVFDAGAFRKSAKAAGLKELPIDLFGEALDSGRVKALGNTGLDEHGKPTGLRYKLMPPLCKGGEFFVQLRPGFAMGAQIGGVGRVTVAGNVMELTAKQETALRSTGYVELKDPSQEPKPVAEVPADPQAKARRAALLADIAS